MSDLNSDLLTQEVDDEVRRERMLNLWKAYGKFVIGGAVAIVAIVAGNEGYKAYVTSEEQKNSTAFEAAVEAAGRDGADAVKVWEDAAPTLGSGYGALAKLQLAAAATEAGDLDRAIAAYDAVASDSSTDEAVRAFGDLQAGMLLAGKKGDLDGAKARLSTIAQKGNAWYYSAQEQLALIDIQQGNLDDALSKFTLLADDAETPQSIRGRAGEFRSFIEAKQGIAVPAMEAPADEAEAAAEEGDAQ
ncbi:tetratricopeptide repeat protein [Kordiimonas gwangyangensis]|uniref:tetratricopeptide repeat protein n=1 Tax=Kordiimonas gwangyangensis TaxID=288022 RepID=UPI000369932D|nr:tetratricopeptide repeat protein [Kordiimonas gwangyangensis]